MRCRHCPGFPCDPDIHEASLSIRRWLRAKLNHALEPVVIGKRNMDRPMKPIGEVPLIDKRTL